LSFTGSAKILSQLLQVLAGSFEIVVALAAFWHLKENVCVTV